MCIITEVHLRLKQECVQWDLEEGEEYSESLDRGDLPCKTAFLAGRLNAVELDQYEMKSYLC